MPAMISLNPTTGNVLSHHFIYKSILLTHSHNNNTFEKNKKTINITYVLLRNSITKGDDIITESNNR